MATPSMKESQKKWREANDDIYRAVQRKASKKWRDNHKEHCNELSNINTKKWYAKMRDEGGEKYLTYKANSVLATTNRYWFNKEFKRLAAMYNVNIPLE